MYGIRFNPPGNIFLQAKAIRYLKATHLLDDLH